MAPSVDGTNGPMVPAVDGTHGPMVPPVDSSCRDLEWDKPLVGLCRNTICQKYPLIRVLPGEALVVTFFVQGDFSAKLLQTLFLSQSSASIHQLQTQS